MRKKIAAAALIGSLGLTGGLLVAPGMATAADSEAGTGVSSRVTAIKDALKGLVADKSITQAQADKVATTLEQKLPARGERAHGLPGKKRHGLVQDAAAVIGITPVELITQLRDGKTLTQVAQAEGLSRAALLDGLVKRAEARMAKAVAAGKLTQAQADAKEGDLRAHLSAKIDAVGKKDPMGKKQDTGTDKSE